MSKRNPAPEVSFGTFGRLTQDENPADIFLGANLGVARNVGIIERQILWTNTSLMGGNSAYTGKVVGYCVEPWGADDEPELVALSGKEFDVDVYGSPAKALKACKDAVRAAFARRGSQS